MKALSEELNGAQVNVEMRAGASGRLYGSVTSAIVAEELSKMMEREIDRRTVEIAEPIRQVGMYEVGVRLHAEVDTSIKLLVYPLGSDPETFLSEGKESEEDDAAPRAEEAEDVAAEAPAVADDAKEASEGE